MKSSIKSLQDANSLQDLRTYTGSVRKSGKPDLPTTAILDLYMRKNERDRILKELKRLKKRKGQLQTRLTEVEKEMTKLVAKAKKTATEIRGKKEGRSNPGNLSKKKGRTILEY